jgi:Transposase DDE domain group 1
VVSHAGARLLADLADYSTLTGRLSAALGSLCTPQTVHDPGRVLADLAVAIGDGAECISDIATLADQPGLFGPVASDSTVWRLLERLDDSLLAEVAAARAAARETAWAQRAETAGAAYPPACAGGRQLPELVIDLDATIVVAHSEKEQAAPTFSR